MSDPSVSLIPPSFSYLLYYRDYYSFKWYQSCHRKNFPPNCLVSPFSILIPFHRVGVYVGAGSRNEDLETSGTAHLLEKMLLRGTSSRNKSEIAQTIENMGARVNFETGREISSYSLQVFRGDVGKAAKLLGDLVCNSTLNDNELELVKEEVNNEHEDNIHRYMETTIENVHFNVYREHMMGQPVKGDRDILHTLRADNLRDFHTTNFFGDNIVIVGTGNINHDEFVNQVS